MPALAWSFEGCEIIIGIGRAKLSPAVRAKVDAILATDTDSLTGHDMASDAIWADVYWSHCGQAISLAHTDADRQRAAERR